MLTLPSAILAVLCSFSPLFSRPTYLKLLVIATGHLLCGGKRTVTNCLRFAGFTPDKNPTSYYDVFRRATWSSFKASKILLFLIDSEFVAGDVLRIVVDTTLERRRGPRLYGIGMHRDAIRSSKGRKAFSPGHNWLVACVVIRFPGTKIHWSLPFISILLKPKKPLASSKNIYDQTSKRRHKKITKYTEQLIHVLRRWLGPDRKIALVADSAFCCREICRACIKRDVTFLTRFRFDASLFSEPPSPTGKRGRRRVVGERQPNLDQVASNPNTIWKTYSVQWYGAEIHTIEIATGTALWYHNSTGKPVPIRWILTRDLEDPKEITPILCTNLNFTPDTILEYFVQRWSIETTFQEVRSHMGYEGIYTRADKGIERVSPSIMVSYSIVCLIAARAMKQNKEEIHPNGSSWYHKTHVTFSDVLSYVKSLIIKENIFPQCSQNRAVRKKTIYEVLFWAMTG